MNINKWLCKYFDDDKKGYVTIWNIIEKMLSTIFNEITLALFAVFVIIPILIGAVYLAWTHPELNNKPFPFEYITIYTYVKAWIIGIIPYMAIAIIYYIGKIKIAKCPLKEGDEK